MGLSDLEAIPDSGAVFTIGRSRFADNIASHFFIRKDPVVSITCGDEHSAVICQTGRLFVFGSNDWGQLGLGHKNHISKPSCVKVLKPEKVTHVACGRAHTLICTDSQKIFACGSDQEGQLGRGRSAIGDSASSPVLVYDTGLAGPTIVQIAAGSHHSLALTSDGGVFAWGSNLEGQLGLPDVSGLVNKPTKVHIPEPVKQISAGYYHSSFLTESGLVYVCGETESGKLGIEAKFSTQIVPKQMQLPGPAVHVACGGHHTIILADNGNLYCTGSNSCGQLGLGSNVTELDTPKLLPRGALQNESVSHIGCGESHTAIVTGSGKLFTCGDGRHGKLGLEENENNVHELTFAPRYKELVVSKVACGGCHTILVGCRRAPINSTAKENETSQMETLQKRGTLPPLKVPLSRRQNDLQQDKINENVTETNSDENNTTEELAAESKTESVQMDAENNEETATNRDTDSMNNIEKADSPEKSAESSPRETTSDNESTKQTPEVATEEPRENSATEEPKPENDDKEAENNNNNNVPEAQTESENPVQETKTSEDANDEEKNEENNNVANEETAGNESEDAKRPNEEDGATDNRENEDSEPGDATAESGDKDKEEKSPARMTSGSTPPPKPPRLKSGSSNSSSTGKEDEPNEANAAADTAVNKEPEIADDDHDEEESARKRETRSVKSSTKSESSRSTRSKHDTDETIEIDKQTDKEKIIEEEKMNNDRIQDDADVVQSPAPRTGKMAKIFKAKRQQAIENGTKIASNASHKSKSKTCNIL
nr:X-linked retinitis pigmentosa GTPase regulator-like [Megalopta genalis]